VSCHASVSVVGEAKEDWCDSWNTTSCTPSTSFPGNGRPRGTDDDGERDGASARARSESTSIVRHQGSDMGAASQRSWGLALGRSLLRREVSASATSWGKEEVADDGGERDGANLTTSVGSSGSPSALLLLLGSRMLALRRSSLRRGKVKAKGKAGREKDEREK
jgi:hypothetical protein